MRRSPLSSALAFVALTFVLLGAVLVAGWRPLLGLDLQGGVAVVLRPVTEADERQIAQAVEIIRNRVDAIGVAEPDITVQGGNVVVQLPGVKDRERALELVGSTAELRFRPVLQVIPSPGLLEAATGSSTSDATTTTAAGASTSSAPGTTTTPGSVAPSTAPTPSAPSTTSSGSGQQQSLAPSGGGEGRPDGFALASYRQETTTTLTSTGDTQPVPEAVTSTVPATTAPTDTTATSVPSVAPDAGQIPGVTPRDQDTNEATVVMPEFDRESGKEVARYVLGPTIVTGDALVASDTVASVNPQTGAWFVALTFKDGDQNIGGWRRAAAACFGASNPAVCPTGRLAAVLDGEVISAPTVNDRFEGSNDAVITGSFSQREAQDLAQKLRYGALPVTFERQQSQDVSATVGRDALRAGVAAGVIGLVVVALYILLYYRLLGVVALASLALSFSLLWAIISTLGETRGLALSLAGVVGIIVSIGISIDSNIVYFEQIKDDMATGRSLSSSSQRAFRGAMSTIVKADLVSLIGAGLLYWLTVGPVKGFALFLGLSTLLDLLASYYFMRPAVLWLSRWPLATRNPKAFGIPAPMAPPHVVGAAAAEATR